VKLKEHPLLLKTNLSEEFKLTNKITSPLGKKKLSTVIESAQPKNTFQ
jgi:hypothetical protein